MRVQPRGRGNEGGSAIVFTLMVLALLLVVGTVSTTSAVRSSRELGSSVDQRRAHHLAEAALAEAMLAIRAKAPGDGAIATQAQPAFLGGGVLWVTSTDIGGGQRLLSAQGMYGSGRASLAAVVELEDQLPLFATVMNSRENLTLNSSVVVDSFDSELGDYASQVGSTYGIHSYANDGGDVASNGSIVLNSDATVFGDATPGPGETVSFASGSYVSGATTAAASPFAFPPVVVPSVPSGGPLTLAQGAAVTIPTGTHGFDDLDLGKASVLTVEGPATVVVDNFTGGKDARLMIDATNGPVTFFVQGNYVHMSNFEAQPVGASPMAVAFMIEGSGGITFPSNTNVRGAYYAPQANVLFGSSNEAWGSFAANRVDMSSSMKFHYDESLAKHWDTSGSANNDPLHLLAWHQAEFTPATLLKDRRDPFQALGVDPANLLSPSASW